jgi:hypothetical protein
MNDLNKLLKNKCNDKIICPLSNEPIKTAASTIKNTKNTFEKISLIKYVKKYNKHPITNEKCDLVDILENDTATDLIVLLKDAILNEANEILSKNINTKIK